MTINSTLIENVNIADFFSGIRSIVREELHTLQAKEPAPRFLSRHEVAELLKISLPTLNQYTRRGILKGSRIGNRVLYSESDILEAVKDIPTRKYRR